MTKTIVTTASGRTLAYNLGLNETIETFKNGFRVSREMLKNDQKITVSRANTTKYMLFNASDKSITVYS